MSFRGTLLAAGLPLAWATAAVAQILPPPTPPMSAPVRVSPSSGIYAYTYGTPNLAFVWDQTPFLGFPSQFPTHYLFCLKRVTDPDCSHATAVASLLPSQIPSTTLRNQFTFQPIGTRYTYTPMIPDTKLDYIVAWQVLGCRSNADSSCRQSSHAWMVASTVELRADNVSGNVIGSNYNVSADGINVGTRSVSSHPSQPHHTLWIREVLIDSTGTVCRTDPNAADIRNETTTLSVIDSRGRLTLFSALPRDNAGNFIVTDVRAIFRSGSHFQTHETTSGPLPPNQSSMIDIQTVSVPVNTRPRAFASALIMDSREVIPEPSETNNGHAECEVVF
jgi:hypothetical protein